MGGLDVEFFALEQKKNLLEILYKNLQKEKELLLEGDADHALEWEKENQKILKKLQKIDRKIEETKDSLCTTESYILLTQEIFDLVKKARELQEEVQQLLIQEKETARKEWAEVSVKRQLKSWLQNPGGLDWKKRIC